MSTLIPADWRTESPEVAYTDGGFFAASPDHVEALKTMAQASCKRRARLCFHSGPDARQQEMLIVMAGDAYVRPHRHLNKSETLTVFEGCADCLLFDEDGAVTDSYTMAHNNTCDGFFFYRMPPRMFHTLRFRSEWFVFLETTRGPFNRADSEVASFAPSEDCPADGLAWMAASVGRI